MPKTTKIDLPEGSRLHAFRVLGDFVDCYSVASDLAARPAGDIIGDFPGWVRGLLRVRSILVAPFGLSADGPESDNRIGPFPVEYEDAEQVIAGFDDRHLNFRVGVMAQGGQVSLATWVDPHNLGGRLYLGAIMPFHVAIAHNALARVAAAR